MLSCFIFFLIIGLVCVVYLVCGMCSCRCVCVCVYACLCMRACVRVCERLMSGFFLQLRSILVWDASLSGFEATDAARLTGQ